MQSHIDARVLTKELKDLNRYWFMLSATLNELGTALNQKGF